MKGRLECRAIKGVRVRILWRIARQCSVHVFLASASTTIRAHVQLADRLAHSFGLSFGGSGSDCGSFGTSAQLTVSTALTS